MDDGEEEEVEPRVGRTWSGPTAGRRRFCHRGGERQAGRKKSPNHSLPL